MRRIQVLMYVFVQTMLLPAQRTDGSHAYSWDNADMARRLGAQSYRIPSTQVNTLGLDVEALAFFKDNEFDGNVLRGYSLPGVRLQPRLTYTPVSRIRLELGLHATIYSGANKYPCYVYHDITAWKGDQYQSGAHLLPFFRATASFDHVTLVLGNIYGGATHALAEPVYNPELILTDDPEAGVQLIVDTRRWHSDLWLNWQSYIFEESTHQEAFTVGWSQSIGLLQRKGDTGAHHLSLPIQLLIQHRGGEQDVSSHGVQTIVNGAAGLRYEYSAPSDRGLTGVGGEIMGLYCFQQSGNLWSFRNGAGIWAEAHADFMRDLRVSAGFFTAGDFCSLYGSPFFGTLSTKHPGGRFSDMTTGMIGVSYTRTFARDYTVGAHVKAYLCHTGRLAMPADEEHPDGRVMESAFRTPFSFGVYFRCSPSFVLKRFGHTAAKQKH